MEIVQVPLIGDVTTAVNPAVNDCTNEYRFDELKHAMGIWKCSGEQTA